MNDKQMDQLVMQHLEECKGGKVLVIHPVEENSVGIYDNIDEIPQPDLSETISPMLVVIYSDSTDSIASLKGIERFAHLVAQVYIIVYVPVPLAEGMKLKLYQSGVKAVAEGLGQMRKSLLDFHEYQISYQHVLVSLFDSLAEVFPGGLIILRSTTDGKSLHVIKYNKKLLDLGGWSKMPDIIDIDCLTSFIPAPDVNRFVFQLSRVLDGELSSFSIEHRIQCYNGSEERWVNSRLSKLEGLKGYFAYSMEDISKVRQQWKKLESRRALLRRKARHDLLTGLYNRETFVSCTSKLLRMNPHTDYVMIYLDVSKFRMVNEVFGHSSGNVLLVEIASVLSDKTKFVGTYGRLENDSFVLCVEKEQFDAEKLSQLLSIDLSEQGILFRPLINFGVYEIVDHTLGVETMLARAYLALQSVKGDCICTYAYYDPSMSHAVKEEQQIHGEMELALKTGQFVLYYQPVFSLEQNKAVSAEVLVRWKHPVKGLLAPAQFLPVFEQNGFIIKLDQYVLEHACIYLAERKAHGLPLFPISVNLSRRSISSETLGQQQEETVRSYGLDPSMVKIEITESAYMVNTGELIAMVNDLRKRGFVVMMDDFGSGYSSLNILKDLPVDYLKIDMRFLSSFKSSEKSRDIINFVVRMAKWMGLKVIAEGVETLPQLSFLRGIGCDLVQGYYYAKPMPPQELDDFIEKNGLAIGSPLPLNIPDKDFQDCNLAYVTDLLEEIKGAVAFVLVSPDGRLELLTANRYYIDRFSDEDILLDDLGKLGLFGEDHKIFCNLINRVLNSHRILEEKVHLQKPDGTIEKVQMIAAYLGTGMKSPIIYLSLVRQ
ncbi:MAG: bifunctional diguanylate cyclase/phosphodiesterase [Spirochaetia bacterium]|nr:bifunctional diguanylate cyclase/phosphodiesterase [Spirochaetia bacterium]